MRRNIEEEEEEEEEEEQEEQEEEEQEEVEAEYHDNQLNIAFIAEDSREVRSVSISITGSEPESQSVISHLHCNANLNWPFVNFDPEISSMEEWPVESPDLFCKKIRNPELFGKKIRNSDLFGKKMRAPDLFGKKMRRDSRKSESIIEENEESNEEERQIEKMSKCTKRRMGSKMKVITVGAAPQVNSYLLRSKKQKDVQSVRQAGDLNCGSSSDQLREIVDEIDGRLTTKRGDSFNKNHHFH